MKKVVSTQVFQFLAGIKSHNFRYSEFYIILFRREKNFN